MKQIKKEVRRIRNKKNDRLLEESEIKKMIDQKRQMKI